MIVALLVLVGCGEIDDTVTAAEKAPFVAREELSACDEDTLSASHWMASDGYGPDAILSVWRCDAAMQGAPSSILDRGAPCQPVTGAGRIYMFEDGSVQVACLSGAADGESSWYEIRWVVPASY